MLKFKILGFLILTLSFLPLANASPDEILMEFPGKGMVSISEYFTETRKVLQAEKDPDKKAALEKDLISGIELIILKLAALENITVSPTNDQTSESPLHQSMKESPYFEGWLEHVRKGEQLIVIIHPQNSIFGERAVEKNEVPVEEPTSNVSSLPEQPAAVQIRHVYGPELKSFISSIAKIKKEMLNLVAAAESSPGLKEKLLELAKEIEHYHQKGTFVDATRIRWHGKLQTDLLAYFHGSMKFASMAGKAQWVAPQQNAKTKVQVEVVPPVPAYQSPISTYYTPSRNDEYNYGTPSKMGILGAVVCTGLICGSRAALMPILGGGVGFVLFGVLTSTIPMLRNSSELILAAPIGLGVGLIAAGAYAITAAPVVYRKMRNEGCEGFLKSFLTGDETWR